MRSVYANTQKSLASISAERVLNWMVRKAQIVPSIATHFAYCLVIRIFGSEEARVRFFELLKGKDLACLAAVRGPSSAGFTLHCQFVHQDLRESCLVLNVWLVERVNIGTEVYQQQC